MGKKRVYEFAKEIKVPSKQVVEAAEKAGLAIKNHMAMIDDAGQAKVKAALQGGQATPVKQPSAQERPSVKNEKPVQKDEHTGKTKILVSAIRRPKSKPNAAHASVHGVRSTTRIPRDLPRRERQRPETKPTVQPAVNAAPAKQPTPVAKEETKPVKSVTATPQTDKQSTVQSAQQTTPPTHHTTNSQEPKATVTTTKEKDARATSTNRPRQEQRTQNASTNRNETKGARPDQSRNQNQGQNRSRSNNTGSNQNRNRNASSNQNQSQNRNRPNTNTTSQSRNRPNTGNTQTSRQPVAATTGESSDRNNNRNRNRNSNTNNNNYRSNDNRFGGNKRNRHNKRNNRRRENEHKKPMPQRKDRPLPDVLVYTEGMNAQDLGKLLHREPAEIVKKLFMLGVMVNQNQSLGDEAIELVATDYGIDAKKKVEQDISDLDAVFEKEQESKDNLVPRPPVVTIMGHVDHGKTTLLDKLRHTHVTEGEAGGITQHIGAYQTKLDGRVITFLDTPGHAAFTEMRARGADVTDIIILVVAADDGVMPQTIEAINHAKAAKAPIIVAVNKIDKPGANPNHVMEQLTEYDLIPEDWGGDTIFVNISAKYGKNLDELLEMILLQADVMELKANPKQPAVGTVLEAKLDKGRGPVASLLVQQGTLKTGDPIVVGDTFGKVRVMTNDRGRRIKEALPAEPVEITGLSDVPNAADHFVVFKDEKTARAVGEERAKNAQEEERKNTNHVTLDNLFETMKEGQLKEVDVIIKADVQGSVEALAGSLKKIEVQGVRVNIIHQAVGAINESDVTLAAASNAIIIGFNVRPTPLARQQADSDKVDIRLHRVIYKAIDEVESAMKGMLEPEYEEKITGNLKVQEIYHASKLGTIAGCMVTSGYISRDSGVRLIRDGIVVHEGKLASLKRFKDDVKEVRQGFECGLTIDGYNDIKVDDELEAYVMEEVPVQ